ncbi:MAG: PulJ/GspJ family protein [bacterium]
MLKNKKANLNKINNKGFTLPELLVSIALALSIMLILALSISKMSFIMRKLSAKYYVSSTSKNILNKLSSEIIKNSNFNFIVDPIFKLTPNEMGFTTSIVNQRPFYVKNNFNYLIIQKILVKGRGINRDYLFKVRKIIYDDTNNNGNIDSSDIRTQNEINLGLIEQVLDSELYFESRNVNLVRVSIRTDFIFRNQRSRIIYYLDVPVNSK